MIRRRLVLVLLVLVACGSCKPAPSRPRVAKIVAPIFEVELKPLTPLIANTPTHVVVDSLGNICWVQESEAGDDNMFIIGEGEIPRSTNLTSARILAALGASGGSGNIQSLAAGRNGALYFYFLG